MNQIFVNILDPSWWFTGVFFVVVGVLVNKSVKILPRINKNIKKSRRLEVLKVIKSHRQHDLKIYWLIGRYWSLGTISIGLLIFSAYNFFLMPSISDDKWNLLVPVLMFLLAYWSMFWLGKEKELIHEVIEENIKWKKLRNKGLNTDSGNSDAAVFSRNTIESDKFQRQNGI